MNPVMTQCVIDGYCSSSERKCHRSQMRSLIKTEITSRSVSHPALLYSFNVNLNKLHFSLFFHDPVIKV